MPDLLQAAGPEIWTAAREVNFYGLRIPHTMAVVRLEGGALLLHSPLAPDPGLVAELAALGEVRAVVAPTYFHDMHLNECAAAFPQATVHLTPALRRLPVPHSLLEPEGGFGDDLAYFKLGGLAMGEFAFFHRPSRSLILADLVFNLGGPGAEVPVLTGLALRVDLAYKRPAVPLSVRLLAIRDRARLRAAVDRMLAWDFETIVVGHGTPIARHAKAVLRDAFRFLEQSDVARLVEADRDHHVAEIARASDARAVVTEDRRHFSGLLRHGVPVLTAEEFTAESKL